MKTDYDPARYTGRYYCPDYARIAAAEIAVRVAYGATPWWQRLVTPPPPGWPGGWTARLLTWGRQHMAQRERTR